MLKRIAMFIRNHDWFAVIVEILVVVVGLLLAFQLDGWRNNVEERQQERLYVDRLIDDLNTDIPDIEYAIDLQSLRLDLIELLMRVAVEPGAATADPIIFLGAVDQAAYTYTPTLTSHTFENLRATGDLRLIRSDEVKDILFDYYGFDDEQRQYRPLQFQTESRHFELAAGVLSNAQATFIQDKWLFFRPNEMEEVRRTDLAVEGIGDAALRLQAKAELVEWLPYVRSMQLEQIEVHEARLQRARSALDSLTRYADEIRRQ